MQEDFSNIKFDSPEENDFPPHSCGNEKDKDPENLESSPLKNDMDVSLYGGASPEKSELTCNESCSSADCLSRRCDTFNSNNTNSQDSGYSSSNFSRQHSMEFLEDEFMVLEDVFINKNANPVENFDSLLHGSFLSFPDGKPPLKPTLKRSKSECEPQTSDNNCAARLQLFKNDNVRTSPLKRSDSVIDPESPNSHKRIKSDNYMHLDPSPKPVFHRSISATEESIMNALQKSSMEPDLIGDFSTTFCLPLTSGRHQDLKAITPATLAMLLNGEFANKIASYKIIDCRYPYEYEGGHINTAVNIYTKTQVLEELLNVNSPPCPLKPEQHHILIFHCEFSSERGPNMCRFLRNQDRIKNKFIYPALYYPELYILEGGYKNFYSNYSDLCVPVAYMPMLHPEHYHDLSRFKAESRSSDRLYLK